MKKQVRLAAFVASLTRAFDARVDARVRCWTAVSPILPRAPSARRPRLTRTRFFFGMRFTRLPPGILWRPNSPSTR